MRADIDIDGRGFYQITANTAAGEAFLASVQGTDHGVAYASARWLEASRREEEESQKSAIS